MLCKREMLQRRWQYIQLFLCTVPLFIERLFVVGLTRHVKHIGDESGHCRLLVLLQSLVYLEVGPFFWQEELDKVGEVGRRLVYGHLNED